MDMNKVVQVPKYLKLQDTKYGGKDRTLSVGLTLEFETGEVDVTVRKHHVNEKIGRGTELILDGVKDDLVDGTFEFAKMGEQVPGLIAMLLLGGK